MTGTSRRDDIVAAALSLLEEHGPDGVTMRSIAQRLGIQAPSLYKHITDKSSLELELMTEGLRDWAERFDDAVQNGADPLQDVADAYRQWALSRPHLYRLMTDKPLPRDQLPPGLEAAAAMPMVRAVNGDRDLARVAWALVHGLASLEMAGRFPPDADLDAAWRTAVRTLRVARPAPPKTRGKARS